MSRYESLNKELKTLRSRQLGSCLGPGTGVGMLVGFAMSEAQIGFPLLIAVASTIAASIIFHFAWQCLFPAYARWSERAAHLINEIAQIRAKIAAIFNKYPERTKGQQFKKAYQLANKPLWQLEESLAVGMHREEREVFVTAFMANQIAVRVTASIGSAYRCSAADNPARWPSHVESHQCDSIRQYHNHPVHNGKTSPSAKDFQSARSLRKILGSDGSKLRSFIICWNAIGEWKIIEYDADGRYWLHAEFDPSAEKFVAADVLPV